MTFFKKRLTSGALASPAGGSDEPDPSRSSVEPARDERPVLSTDNLDKPVSKLASARWFVRRFLLWCVNVGISGPTDLPRIYTLALEFAEFANLRPPTERALAMCLTQLGIRKYVREIKASDRGIVSRRRSKAGRPRVTVYDLPSTIACYLDASDDQLDLFD